MFSYSKETNVIPIIILPYVINRSCAHNFSVHLPSFVAEEFCVLKIRSRELLVDNSNNNI